MMGMRIVRGEPVLNASTKSAELASRTKPVRYDMRLIRLRRGGRPSDIGNHGHVQRNAAGADHERSATAHAAERRASGIGTSESTALHDG